MVTDRDGLEAAVNAVGWPMPGEVKVFDNDHRDDALAWLAGS